MCMTNAKDLLPVIFFLDLHLKLVFWQKICFSRSTPPYPPPQMRCDSQIQQTTGNELAVRTCPSSGAFQLTAQENLFKGKQEQVRSPGEGQFCAPKGYSFCADFENLQKTIKAIYFWKLPCKFRQLVQKQILPVCREHFLTHWVFPFLRTNCSVIGIVALALQIRQENHLHRKKV